MVKNTPTSNKSTKASFPEGITVENYEPSEYIHQPFELFGGNNKAVVNSSGRLLVDMGGTAEITVALDSSTTDLGGDNVQLRAYDGSVIRSVACNSSGHLLTSAGASTQDVSIVSERQLSNMRSVVLSASTASSSIEVDLGNNQEFIIQNRGSVDIYALASTTSSTVSATSGVRIASGGSFSSYGKASFTVFSAVTSSGTADVEVTVLSY